MEFAGIIDIFILGCGLYCLYACFNMKTRREINKTILMNKEIDIEKCRDKEGYISYILPRFLVFSIATTIYGALCVVNSYVASIGKAIFIIMAVFFVFVIWFAIETKKAYKKYFM